MVGCFTEHGPYPPVSHGFAPPPLPPFLLPFRTLPEQATGLQAPEVPPDGALTIAFGAPVEAAFIAPVVVIEAVGVIGIDGSLSDLGPDAAASPATISNVTAGPCPLLTRLEARQTAFAVCVAVANLRASTLYRLTIPAGTAYHPLAGILATAIEAPVTGLMPFRFAMVQEQLPSDSPSWNEFRPYYRVSVCLSVCLSVCDVCL